MIWIGVIALVGAGFAIAAWRNRPGPAFFNTSTREELPPEYASRAIPGAVRAASIARLRSYVYESPWPGGPRYEVFRRGGVQLGDVVGTLAAITGIVAGTYFGGVAGGAVGGAAGALAREALASKAGEVFARRERTFGDSTLGVSQRFATDMLNAAKPSLEGGKILAPSEADITLLKSVVATIVRRVGEAQDAIRALGGATTITRGGETQTFGGRVVDQEETPRERAIREAREAETRRGTVGL